MPKKLKSCVAKVKKQGNDESSAFAICSSSTGIKRKKGGGWTKGESTIPSFEQFIKEDDAPKVDPGQLQPPAIVQPARPMLNIHPMEDPTGPLIHILSDLGISSKRAIKLEKENPEFLALIQKMLQYANPGRDPGSWEFKFPKDLFLKDGKLTQWGKWRRKFQKPIIPDA